MVGLTDYIRNDDIHIEVQIIGYKSQGESILIFLKDYNEIIWAGIIDSYKLNINVAKEILEDNGFGKNGKKLNFLCISHPDFDHIKNMAEIMQSFIDESTIILTSDFLELEVEGDSREISEIKAFFSEAFKRINQDNINKLFLNRNYGEPRLEHVFFCRGRQIPFKILSLLPTDAQILNKRINRMQNKDKNLYSLFVIIEIGSTELVFAGDCENGSLRYIDEIEIPDRINCFKIPHHASKTSDGVFNWEMSEKELGISVCTTRTMNNTTSTEILEIYKDVFDNLYLTGDTNPEKNTEDYGIVILTFDSRGKIIANPKFIKNASCNEK